jgi:O-antigen ligase
VAGVELFFFYLLASASPLSIAAINVAQGGLACFFLARLLNRRWKPSPAVWLLISFFAWNAVSALLSPLRAEALNGVLNYWSWSALLIASALPREIRDHYPRWLDFLSLSVLLTLPMSLLEFFWGTDILHMQALYRKIPAGTENAYGYFSQHLTYAGVLSACLLMVAAAWLYGKRIRTPVVLAGAGSAAMGLVLSMARTYYLAVIPAAVLLLWGKGKRRLIQAGLALVILAAVAFAAAPAALRQRVENLGDMKNASNSERIYLWISGFHMWMERPLAGWGPGIYEQVVDPFKAPYADRIHYPDHTGFQTKGHCHNLFLMIAIQSGAVGLLLFFAFTAAAVRELLRQDDLALRYGGLAVLAVFLVGGLFEYNGGDAEVATLAFFLIGLAITPGESRKAKVPESLGAREK